MQCEDLAPLMLEYLAGTLPDDVMARLRIHLESCPACRHEMEAADEMWHELGTLPAARPDSAAMRARFDATLHGYLEAMGESRPESAFRLRVSAAWRPWVPALAAAALVLLGIGLGRAVLVSKPDPEMALLRQELRDTRQMVTLSLLQQQSASERLKGVTSSSTIDQPGTEVVSALLDTLMRDPNVNVRLASVDALRRFVGRDTVQRGAVEALQRQDSPLVQIALIDFLLEANGPGTADVLRRLADDMMLDRAVRARAARGLQQVG